MFISITSGFSICNLSIAMRKRFFYSHFSVYSRSVADPSNFRDPDLNDDAVMAHYSKHLQWHSCIRILFDFDLLDLEFNQSGFICLSLIRIQIKPQLHPDPDTSLNPIWIRITIKFQSWIRIFFSKVGSG